MIFFNFVLGYFNNIIHTRTSFFNLLFEFKEMKITFVLVIIWVYIIFTVAALSTSLDSITICMQLDIFQNNMEIKQMLK